MGTVGTRPRAQLPSPGLSVTPTRLLRAPGFHLGAPFLLDSPGTCSFLGRLGLWARARLSSGKAVCAVEKALAWPVGWRRRHILVLAHWRSSSKYAFSPSGSVSPLEQPGTGPGIAKPLSAIGFFSVLQTLSLSWSLVTARVWLSREAAPNLLHRRFWSEAFSCRLEPRLRLGGLLLFVEPGRFQDVIAQGEPSFLPGINKAAYGSARSAQRGWSHSQWASQAQPQGPSPAQPAAPKH